MIADLLFNKQRKLFVTGCAGITILLGFLTIVWRQPNEMLKAFDTMAEWVVILAMGYGGANVAQYFAQRKQTNPPTNPPTTPPNPSGTNP